MKIGIVGTGAVGGFLGAKLHLAGFDVAFLSRGKNLVAVKCDGLRFETNGRIYTIKDAVFTDNPRDLGSCDFYIFTVKSYDTERTAVQIKNIVGKTSTIITPQNGINNDELLAKILGKDKVIPAMIKIGVNTPKPGYVEHTSLGLLTIGEYDGSYSDRIITFEKVAKKARIKIIVSKQIQVDRWKKFIWNCSFNIVAAISGLSVDRILADSYLKQLCTEAMKEVIQIGKKEKLILNEQEIIQRNLVLAQDVGRFTPSTLEDLEKGKPIELDAFTGVVLTLGKKHKVQTPVNTTLYALLHAKVCC